MALEVRTKTPTRLRPLSHWVKKNLPYPSSNLTAFAKDRNKFFLGALHYGRDSGIGLISKSKFCLLVCFHCNVDKR